MPTPPAATARWKSTSASVTTLRGAMPSNVAALTIRLRRVIGPSAPRAKGSGVTAGSRSGAGSAEPEVLDGVSAQVLRDRRLGHVVLREGGERLLHGAGVVIRVAGAPGGDVREDVGQACDRRLPRVEAHEGRPFKEDVLRLEADVADA